MTNKFFKSRFYLAALLLVILFAGLYACSEKIASDETSMSVQANVAPSASVFKTASLLPDVQISSVILYAGQTMNAGTVTLSQTDTNADLAYDAIKVTYTLTGDWTFDTKVHFYIGTGPVPTNTAGNIVPGAFPYILTATSNPFSFNVPFSDLGFQGCTALPLNVAAHAELSSPTLGKQTGFGAGTTTGNSWFTFYTVTLTDKTPPTASNVTTTLGCLSDVPAQTPEVITDEADNCALASVPVTFVDETTSGTCPTTITRNYLVTDAAGNTTAVKFTIVVNDVTAPVWDTSIALLPKVVDCGALIVFDTPKANDCNGYSLSFTDVTAPPVIANGLISTSTTRTWFATDACNNKSGSLSQTITENCPSGPPTGGTPCYDTSSETAWAAGTKYVTKGNWATYVPYANAAKTVNLYAGQTKLIGTASFSANVSGQVTISVNITAAGWELVPGVENVKIQGYSSTPPAYNPSPGLFANKLTGSGTTATITVPAARFYGVHLDVQLKVQVPCIVQ